MAKKKAKYPARLWVRAFPNEHPEFEAKRDPREIWLHNKSAQVAVYRRVDSNVSVTNTTTVEPVKSKKKGKR